MSAGKFLAVLLIGSFGVLIWLAVSEQQEKQRLAAAWTVAAEGVYDRAEYGTNVRAESTSHGGSYEVRQPFTVVYFDDGRTCVMKGVQYSLPFPKGTFIVIRRNGLGEYVIVKK